MERVTDIYLATAAEYDPAAHASSELYVVDGVWVFPPPPDEPPPPPPGVVPDVVVSGHWSTGFTVPAGQVWQILGDVTSEASIVVEGRLTNLDENNVRHPATLQFVGIDESEFEGDTENPINHYKPETDIGLWIIGDGLLDLVGTPKTPWLRAAGGIEAGQDVIVLDAVPAGWQVGDTVVITPTAAPSVTNNWDRYDERTVAAIDGNTLTVDAPCTHHHPIVDGQWTAEILNLTRDVRVFGTSPTQRTHINFNHVHQPQHLANVEVFWVGPRRPTGTKDFTEGLLGRYGMHFHHGFDNVAGTTLDNVVIRDCDNHAFVTHLSNDVTLTGCIAHNVTDDPYWWDSDDRSDNVAYVECVASLVKVIPAFRGNRLSGFNLLAGEGNSAVGCVAVGVQGNVQASGFQWPEGAVGSVWLFENCVSHNNKRNGIFTWQNSAHPHVITAFVAYHNAYSGINHGAYGNRYRYENSALFENGQAGVLLHANSKSDSDGSGFTGALTLAGLTISGGRYGLEVTKHTIAPGQATIVEGCSMSDYTDTAVAFTYTDSNGGSTIEWIDLVDCDFGDGNHFWLATEVDHGSIIRVIENGIPVLRLWGVNDPNAAGTFEAEHNAHVEQLTP